MCRKHSLSSRSSGIQKSLDHEKLLNGHEELILVIVSSGTGMRRIPWNTAFYTQTGGNVVVSIYSEERQGLDSIVLRADFFFCPSPTRVSKDEFSQ